MGCSGPSVIAYMAWIVGIIVVIALVYLGCTELGKTGAPPGTVSGFRGPSVSGRRTSSSGARSTQGEFGVSDGSAVNGVHQPQDGDQAFNSSFKVDTHNMVPIDGTAPSPTALPSSNNANLPQWENSWNPDSTYAEQQFKPVNKEGAKKGANHLAYFGMQMQRDACRPKGQVDVIGALRPKTAPIPINRCPISFNDADCRQVLYNQKTNCWNQGNCPWNNDCQAAAS